MRSVRLPVRLLPICLLLACLASAGCQQDGADTSAARNAARREKPLRPAQDPRVQPHLQRFQRIEALLTRWDALRNDGRNPQALALEPRIRQEVDADFATIERASQGALGPHAQYLAVSALGFSASPRATQLLVDRVTDRDTRLAGNALIALGVRADPNTPQDLLLSRIAPNVPQDVRRYAPLTLAHVLDARARAGLPVDKIGEQQALARLGAIVVDHDPITRLHVARAMSALRIDGTFEYLRVLAGDPVMRVRWAAAAALQRKGDPRGFPEVVRLLHDVAPDSKPVIRDVLVSYAGKIQGRPLTAAEIESLGTGPRAWSQWYTHYQRTRGAAVNARSRNAAVPRGGAARGG